MIKKPFIINNLEFKLNGFGVARVARFGCNVPVQRFRLKGAAAGARLPGPALAFR